MRTRQPTGSQSSVQMQLYYMLHRRSLQGTCGRVVESLCACTICKRLLTLLEGGSGRVRVDGRLSDEFLVGRGVKQGSGCH